MRVVKKYGGSSVSDVTKIKKIAKQIKADYVKGVEQIVVVSAMGKTTNELIEKAKQLQNNSNKQCLDFLLCTGEMTSVAFLCLCLQNIGVPCECFTGGQAGVFTTSNFGNAKIVKMTPFRIEDCLNSHKVAVVAGFQGVNKFGCLTTLGRGGSDTTAVALSVVLKAKCEIYTDVENVYFADPKKYANVISIKKMYNKNALELAFAGSKVLDFRCLELACKYNQKIYLKKSLSKKGGTIIVNKPNFEGICFDGVAHKNNLHLYCVKNRNFIDVLKFVKMQNAKIEFYNVINNDVYFLTEKEDLKCAKPICKCAKIVVSGSGFLTNCEQMLKIDNLIKNNNTKIFHFNISETTIIFVMEDANFEKFVENLIQVFGGSVNG